MVSVLILLIFISGIVIGFRRGLVLQLAHLFSFFLSVVSAYIWYEPLSKHLTLWIPFPNNLAETTKLIFEVANVEKTYYRAIAFVLILIIAKVALQIIASLFDFFASIPGIKTANRFLGAILGFIECYLIVAVCLMFLTFVPSEFIQTSLQKSIIANIIVNYSPFMSSWLKGLWTSL